LPGGSFYIWGGYANCGSYPPFLMKHELYFSQPIIWVKEHPVMTRKNFLGNHEWAFFGWKLGAGHKFYGPKSITDVWSIKKVSPQTMEHLTQKPAELAVRAIQYSSQAGENGLDLFGGSGSTVAVHS
jgi:DNA modification methylase